MRIEPTEVARSCSEAKYAGSPCPTLGPGGASQRSVRPVGPQREGGDGSRRPRHSAWVECSRFVYVYASRIPWAGLSKLAPETLVVFIRLPRTIRGAAGSTKGRYGDRIDPLICFCVLTISQPGLARIPENQIKGFIRLRRAIIPNFV